MLTRFPVEIIVLIAGFSSPVERMALSLCSKRLRILLNDWFDLSLQEQDHRLDFLLLLERDLPDYLTCRACASMFKWRDHEIRRYQCPDTWKRGHMAPHIFHQILCPSNRIRLGPEMIDLMLRAHNLGPNYGIPASYIDHECNSNNNSNSNSTSTCGSARRERALWYRQRTEGRIIANQMFLSRSVDIIEPHPASKDYPTHEIGVFTCEHRAPTWGSKPEILHDIGSWNGQPQAPLDLNPTKCDRCATDVSVRLLPGPVEGLVHVQIRIWQNYGYGSAARYPRSTRQNYGYGSAARYPRSTSITAVEASAENSPELRDLRRVFDDGGEMDGADAEQGAGL